MKYECGLFVESRKQEKPKYSRKTYVIVTLYSTNRMWTTHVLSNSALRDEDPATSFHTLTVYSYFSLSHAVVVMPNCHSSADLTNFTLADHKNWITGHCSRCIRISGTSVWIGHIITTSQKKMNVYWAQVQGVLMAISASFTSGEERVI